ncbi:MAG: GAF domain-containing protein [Chloroherpetonaceae bacterium]|nr:GAF domain-containing protein [Chloroherpetonaceae bacterium]
MTNSLKDPWSVERLPEQPTPNAHSAPKNGNHLNTNGAAKKLLTSIKVDLEKNTDAHTLFHFPFKTSLSLSPLVAYWEKFAERDDAIRNTLGKSIHREIKKIPELLLPIDSDNKAELEAFLERFENHRGLLDTMFSVVFPPVSWESDYMAAFIPFNFQSFYATPPYEKMIRKNGGIQSWLNLNESEMSYGRELKAFTHIAKQIYGLDIQEFQYPFIFRIIDPDTLLDRYFRASINTRFCEIIAHGPVKPLTETEKKRLFANLSDLNVWRELIPREQFEFRGFTIVSALDVTDQEVISGLKRDLIEKESIVSNARFASLRQYIRALMNKPDLRMALASVNKDVVTVLNYNCENADEELEALRKKNSPALRFSISELKDSIHSKAVLESRPILIEDIHDIPTENHCDSLKKLFIKGVRNVFIAPLHYQGDVIGALEISSPNAGDINPINVVRLKEVLPLFSMAVKRANEESNTELQAVIREKFTVIHPSVEWRFQEAAEAWIARQNTGMNSDLDEIIFRDVYPLYGVSDIRNSSLLRNAAIQADMIRQMQLAKEILEMAEKVKPLPLIQEMIFHLNSKMDGFKKSLSSGDEGSAIEFLKHKIETFFPEAERFSKPIKSKIEAYRSLIDPRLGLLYDKRKAFDESVASLSEAIARYFDHEQDAAQKMFPHYYERHKTDGVDHTMYIGASICPDGRFDPLYARNLRLWQLMTICGVARLSDRMKETLTVPLDTAHLILVQSAPLSIRFHIDEKQFDVDGTYNIRYEIMKKRIDKAVVKGESQRVTQPGRIAIIYSQQREIAEYREMIQYLQNICFLQKEVEELELEDMQGVHGLKALRVTVNLSLRKETETFHSLISSFKTSLPVE